MKIKTQGLILKIVSVFVSGLWIAGLIIGNVYLVLLAIAITLVEIPFVYIQRDKLKEMFQRTDKMVVEDERTQLINDKSATMALGIFVAVTLYAAIIILALRNSFPEWTYVGYTLIVAAVLNLVFYSIARLYYSRKY